MEHVFEWLTRQGVVTNARVYVESVCKLCVQGNRLCVIMSERFANCIVLFAEEESGLWNVVAYGLLKA